MMGHLLGKLPLFTILSMFEEHLDRALTLLQVVLPASRTSINVPMHADG